MVKCWRLLHGKLQVQVEVSVSYSCVLRSSSPPQCIALVVSQESHTTSQKNAVRCEPRAPRGGVNFNSSSGRPNDGESWQNQQGCYNSGRGNSMQYVHPSTEHQTADSLLTIRTEARDLSQRQIHHNSTPSPITSVTEEPIITRTSEHSLDLLLSTADAPAVSFTQK